MGEQIFYWSPAKHWRMSDEGVVIGESTYTGMIVEWFPEFYFFAQTGVTINRLLERFSSGSEKEANEILELLIQDRVLVEGILPPREVFSPQEGLFVNPYSEQIRYSKEALDYYVSEQLNRTHAACRSTKIQLETSGALPDIIQKRRSCRRFDMKTPVSFATFSNLLSSLKQRKEDKILYNYASAGGLYPIDVFVYVKPRRVEGVKAGFYYFNPADHSLVLVNNIDQVIKDDHELINQDIFAQSAFSVYLVYNARASMPKYGADGYFYACIEAGIITATLNMVAEDLNVGLCSIGHMNFEEIQTFLKLEDHQVILHAIEGGLKIDG
jgi:SagB-type dehydrogenase family enzyme